MRINVGSENKVKVDAVAELIGDYSFLSNSEVCGVRAESNVSEQPKSLHETVNGAINRAKGAFNGCDLSFGIEDGLMEVPETKTGFMNVCVCAIFDGEKTHMGISSAFEFPVRVVELVKNEGLDINQAYLKVGLTDQPKIGSDVGAIGLLTKGRHPRKAKTKEAIQMALIHLENPELY